MFRCVFNRMTVGRKLFAILAIGAGALLASGGIAAMSLASVKTKWHSYLNVVCVKQSRLTTMHAEMGYGGGIHSLKNYVLRGDEKYFRSHVRKADTILAQVKAYRSAGSLTRSERESLRAIETMVATYRSEIHNARRLNRAGHSAQEIDRTIRVNDEPYLRALTALSAELDQQTAERTEALTRSIQHTVFLLACVIGTSLIVLTIVGTLLSRSITGPLDETVQVLESVASGDLSQRLEISSRDELGRLANALNTAVAASAETLSQVESTKQAADAANRAKTEFLANMSHEIRTPMTAILGYSDLLLEELTQPQNIETTALIKKNGQHLLEIINDILDLSKIEADKLEVEQIPCSPHQIISDVASLMRVRGDARGLPLYVHYGSPIPATIQSDPTRLRQILFNLVSNAIKFTEAGCVRMVIQMVDDSIRNPKLQVDVIDTGIGISEEQVEGLFQPFTQADTSTTRKFGGTGLGLMITRRLTQRLGGAVSVASTPGRGSTFSVTIRTGSLEGVPMVQHSSESILGNAGGIPQSATHRHQLECRVLLAEDAPDNQRLIGFLLRKAGADVTIAENGKIACELALDAVANDRPFDVILMDMQMPIRDGYDATRMLRQSGYDRPIVALTAHAMKADRQKCVDAGCDDYATKPIDRDKLISLVAFHAHSHEAVRSDARSSESPL